MQAASPDLGRISSVTGSNATARLVRRLDAGADEALTVGHLVGVRGETSLVVGTVVRMTSQNGSTGNEVTLFTIQ